MSAFAPILVKKSKIEGSENLANIECWWASRSRSTPMPRSKRPSYRTGGSQLLVRLKTLWVQDFERTSGDIRKLSIGSSLPTNTWEVERELANAADKIRTQVVNSEMRDAIDYDGNGDLGLSIVAIGGDKLSRGLTLEGLTVSYFLRASKMYDSLMQMGRWFGYRPSDWSCYTRAMARLNWDMESGHEMEKMGSKRAEGVTGAGCCSFRSSAPDIACRDGRQTSEPPRAE
jgi:hypothetical protein